MTAEVGLLAELQWQPVIYLPVNLTVRLDAAALKSDNPRQWSEQKAAELLGPNARGRQVSSLARCLKQYVEYFRKGNLPATAALFFYPDFTRIPPRAEVQIYLVGEGPVVGPMTLARAREIYGPDERSFGETEMTETEVPTGPALRVYRFRKLEPSKRRSRTAGELAWVICPPDSTQAVMMITTWSESAFSEAAISIADDIAQNFRIEPNRSEG